MGAGQFISPSIIQLPIAKFRGLTVLVTGNSITEVNTRTTKNWHSYLADWFGYTVKNDGKSSTGLIRDNGTDQGIYTRIDTWDSTYGNFDAIIIMGNMNDGGLGSTAFPVGNFTDSVATDSQYGALHATIQKLIGKYPHKPILWVISTPRLANTAYPTPHDGAAWGVNSWFEPYCQAILEVCEHYSIPCLDLYHHSGLRPWNTVNNQLYFSCDSSPSGDGVHPNAMGHEVMAKKIYDFVAQYIGQTVDIQSTDFTFVLGGIITGAEAVVTARARTGFLAYTSGRFTVCDPLKHNIAVFVYSSNTTESYLNNAPSWVTSDVITDPLTQYVRVVLKKMDGTDFTVQELTDMNNFIVYSEI